jgi:hypothetical protein
VNPDGRAPSAAQGRPFLQFLGHSEAACRAVVGAVFDDYPGHRERWLSGDEVWDAIAVPPLPSPDGLKDLIRLEALHMLDDQRGNALLASASCAAGTPSTGWASSCARPRSWRWARTTSPGRPRRLRGR